MDINKELGWDDEISEESSFQLLEEGDYRFRVASFERARHQGSEKIPPCNKAILTIEIIDENGNKLVTITHNLFLHSVVEGLLSAFFLSVGLKKHGEPLKMNFSAVPGTTGWCHVYVDKWTGNDGNERSSNKIRYFIDPEKAPKSASAPTAPVQSSFTGWGKR